MSTRPSPVTAVCRRSISSGLTSPCRYPRLVLGSERVGQTGGDRDRAPRRSCLPCSGPPSASAVRCRVAIPRHLHAAANQPWPRVAPRRPRLAPPWRRRDRRGAAIFRRRCVVRRGRRTPGARRSSSASATTLAVTPALCYSSSRLARIEARRTKTGQCSARCRPVARTRSATEEATLDGDSTTRLRNDCRRPRQGVDGIGRGDVGADGTGGAGVADADDHGRRDNAGRHAGAGSGGRSREERCRREHGDRAAEQSLERGRDRDGSRRRRSLRRWRATSS